MPSTQGPAAPAVRGVGGPLATRDPSAALTRLRDDTIRRLRHPMWSCRAPAAPVGKRLRGASAPADWIDGLICAGI